MSEKKLRKLPRHVDGRIKVGIFPLKNFLMFIPIAILILALTIMFFNPFTLSLGIITIGLVGMAFGEINNRETGLDIIIDSIKYLLTGNKYYERSLSDVPITKKIIINKKVQEVRSRKNTTSN